MTAVDIQTLGKTQFPPLLQEIPDAPDALYIRGEYPDVKSHTFLAVVGSRKYTQYGKDVIEKLIGGLRGYPVVVISGLALGTDALAHRAALNANLRTIAIPGSGLDPKVIYPATNRILAEDILKSGGCLLSEFPNDTKAAPWMFPQRNRVMAGISHAVLVIEATEKSGTLITARLAMEYNRDVLAVPGSIFSENSAGPHALIRDGATPVRSTEDILEVLGLEAKEISTKNLFNDLSPEEKRIVDILSDPLSKDDLVHKTGLPIHKMNILLTSLEMKGVITERMGKVRRK